MKYIIYLLIFSLGVSAQNPARRFLSHNKSGNTVEIAVSDGRYQIRFYNENIIETSFIPTGETTDPTSHAVILKPAQPLIGTAETASLIEYGTDGIVLQIQKSPFRLSYFYRNKLLLSEKEGYIKKDSTEAISFNLDATEALFGGGARVLGMNRRGNRLSLYNRAHYGYEKRAELMNYTIPMVLSSKIYAVHFDNAPIGFLDLDSSKTNTLSYETISGRKTYQVIAAKSWEDLVGQYTSLTGRQPMPPRWVFGNFSSRFGYHSETEARATIAKFQAEKIPVDAIILDLYWFGKDIKGTLGNLEPFRDSFPNFEKMISDFNKMNIKTITVTEPFILTTSSKWQEAVNKNILATDSVGKPFIYDFYFGNTGLIDIFKPQARDWFWSVYKGLADKGVAGVWGDLGEPEVHPKELRHVTGTADQVHNIYGHYWAKMVYEGYRRDFPATRPFILMRSGAAGSQRYGMIPWSGDVNRTWGGLFGQPEIALQMGMQGLAYMHSDLGGFAGENLDDELYTRWLQYGVFQPVFRPHAQEEVASEPVYREEKTKQLAKKAIELRYEMLPYNYTLAHQNHTTGTPLMRPLFFEEPENEKLFSEAHQYLWGDAFLVAPVFEKGQIAREVYFPKGSNWYDLGKKMYKGGGTFTIPLKEDNIPVFVRGGSFVTLLPEKIQNTASYPEDQLVVQYVHDPGVKKSSGIYYEDDGSTPEAFEKGQYEIISFTSTVRGNKIRVRIDSEKGENYNVKERTLSFKFYDLNKVASYPVKIKSGQSKTISIPLRR